MFCQWISGRTRLVDWRKCRDCVLSGMSSHTAVSAEMFMDVFRQWELQDSGSCLEMFWSQSDVMQVEAG